MKGGLAEAQRCMGFALRKATRAITRQYDAALRRSGLRSTQFNLLVALDAIGPITTTELARATAMERTTLTRNLALLAKKQWIRSEPGEDLRSRSVSITARGRKAALGAMPAWRRAQKAVAETLGDRAFAGLMTNLDKLV